jgi:hypothetical protein
MYSIWSKLDPEVEISLFYGTDINIDFDFYFNFVTAGRLTGIDSGNGSRILQMNRSVTTGTGIYNEFDFNFNLVTAGRLASTDSGTDIGNVPCIYDPYNFNSSTVGRVSGSGSSTGTVTATSAYNPNNSISSTPGCVTDTGTETCIHNLYNFILFTLGCFNSVTACRISGSSTGNGSGNNIVTETVTSEYNPYNFISFNIGCVTGSGTATGIYNLKNFISLSPGCVTGTDTATGIYNLYSLIYKNDFLYVFLCRYGTGTGSGTTSYNKKNFISLSPGCVTGTNTETNKYKPYNCIFLTLGCFTDTATGIYNLYSLIYQNECFYVFLCRNGIGTGSGTTSYNISFAQIDPCNVLFFCRYDTGTGIIIALGWPILSFYTTMPLFSYFITHYSLILFILCFYLAFLGCRPETGSGSGPHTGTPTNSRNCYATKL